MEHKPIERIRQALAAGPTPGMWAAFNYSEPENSASGVAMGWHINQQDGPGYVTTIHRASHRAAEDEANAKFIAACSPDAISSLLSRLDELEKDAARLDWMAQRGVWVGWNREGDYCRVWRRSDDIEDPSPEPVCGWEKFFDNPRAAIDSAIAKGA